MKHYLFLQRDTRRVPVAGPYPSDEALEADYRRITKLLNDRDPWTHFDTRVRCKTDDAAAQSEIEASISKRFPQGLTVAA